MGGVWQLSPHIVVDTYHVKKGSQHMRKAPMIIPSVLAALCCCVAYFLAVLVFGRAVDANEAIRRGELTLLWLEQF